MMPRAMNTDSMTRAVTIAEAAGFALSLQDGERHNSGADVGDDQDQLQERSQEHAARRPRHRVM